MAAVVRGALGGPRKSNEGRIDSCKGSRLCSPNRLHKTSGKPIVTRGSIGSGLTGKSRREQSQPCCIVDAKLTRDGYVACQGLPVLAVLTMWKPIQACQRWKYSFDCFSIVTNARSAQEDNERVFSEAFMLAVTSTFSHFVVWPVFVPDLCTCLLAWWEAALQSKALPEGLNITTQQQSDQVTNESRHQKERFSCSSRLICKPILKRQIWFCIRFS